MKVNWALLERPTPEQPPVTTAISPAKSFFAASVSDTGEICAGSHRFGTFSSGFGTPLSNELGNQMVRLA
jgi:hypothetical protein